MICRVSYPCVPIVDYKSKENLQELEMGRGPRLEPIKSQIDRELRLAWFTIKYTNMKNLIVSGFGREWVEVFFCLKLF